MYHQNRTSLCCLLPRWSAESALSEVHALPLDALLDCCEILPVPMSLLHAPQAHHLNPASENLADGVHGSPFHGTRIVAPQSVPVHVVATFAQVQVSQKSLPASMNLPLSK